MDKKTPKLPKVAGISIGHPDFPSDSIERFKHKESLMVSTFLGIDVHVMIRQHQSDLTERLITHLLEEGIEVDPAELRDVCKSAPFEFTEFPVNPDLDGFFERSDRVKTILSIEGDEGIELDPEDVYLLREFLTYSTELIRLLEYDRIAAEGVIRFLKDTLLNGKSKKQQTG